MAARLVAILALGAGACGRIGFGAIAGGGDDASGGDGGQPGGDGGSTADGASPVDAAVSPDASLATTCVNPGNGCTFNGIGPCSCWGMPVASMANVTESGGQLRVTPNASSFGQGQCTRMNVSFSSAGVFVEVSQALTGASITGLTLSNGATDLFGFGVQNGNLISDDTVSPVGRAYSAALMRWWRIRPIAGGVIFETAPDGRTWTVFSTSARVAGATYTVSIHGRNNNDAAPGTAIFEGINVCPP